MKLLWHSNAPWAPTGYGQQVKLFAPYLAKNYDLAISAFYGLEGARLNWEGIPVFPGLGGEYGNLSLGLHAKRWFGGDVRAGLVLTLMDVWVLGAPLVAQMRTASWVPVDHDPVPPRVKQYFIDSGAIPIAMSRFGQEQLADFDPLYVPHGVDTDVFRPRPRAEIRAQVGLEDDQWVVGMVAANKGTRKSFQEAFEAFRVFRQRHEEAVLYLHTTVDPQYSPEGVEILELLAALELPEDSVRIADQYRQSFDPLSPDGMARVYSTLDVLLNPAHGEGFGVPIVEAQAAGIPVIANNHSAMKETCGAGWLVGNRPRWTGQRSWQATPDVGEIVGALEECHGLSDAKREAIRKKAREHALQYAVPKVAEEHFLPALEAVTERLDARTKRPEVALA